MEPALKESMLDNIELQLIAEIQNGLPISNRPYEEISTKLGVSEDEVIDRISNLIDRGLFKRFGVVVHHHEVGYKENAMIVWDVPDEQVHDMGRIIKAYPFITLCYRRTRQLPEWPYNLYCMIHGKSRDNVMLLLQSMIEDHNWQTISKEVLFSKRRFKQRAANYISNNDVIKHG
jgi:siroheme decarboxylase